MRFVRVAWRRVTSRVGQYAILVCLSSAGIANFVITDRSAYGAAELNVSLLVAASVFLVVFLSRAVLARRNRTVFESLFGVFASTALLIYIFANIYYRLGTPEHFGSEMSHLDAVYFALTTFATVGYGDISARSESARAVVSIQIAVDFSFLLLVVGTLVAGLSNEKASDTPKDTSVPDSDWNV